MDKSFTFIDYFSVIPDVRVNRRKKHLLVEIIAITIISVICKCNNWVEIYEFAKLRENWFKKYLKLENGIPSHDTFGRVFSTLDPIEFQKAFINWASHHFEIKENDIISIDGKCISSALAIPGDQSSMIGIVSAWLSNAGITIGMKRADFKKKGHGEKKVFRDMIHMLNLKGMIVTMDANGCHSNITNRIVEKKGDYVVALKNNQKSFYRLAGDLIEKSMVENTNIFEATEKTSGRIEHRKCVVVKVTENLKETLLKKKNVARTNYESPEDWKELNSLVRIYSTREINGKIQSQTRTYISSLDATAERFSMIIRSHWHVENKLHYSIDVSFREDRSTITKGYGAENFSLIRRIAHNLLKKDVSTKKSIEVKRMHASINSEYLEKILGNADASVLVTHF